VATHSTSTTPWPPGPWPPAWRAWLASRQQWAKAAAGQGGTAASRGERSQCSRRCGAVQGQLAAAQAARSGGGAQNERGNARNAQKRGEHEHRHLT